MSDFNKYLNKIYGKEVLKKKVKTKKKSINEMTERNDEELAKDLSDLVYGYKMGNLDNNLVEKMKQSGQLQYVPLVLKKLASSLERHIKFNDDKFDSEDEFDEYEDFTH